MYIKLVTIFITLVALPVMAENRQVNPWAYRNDTLQGQAQGGRPWGEMPAKSKQGNEGQLKKYQQGYYPYSPYQGYNYSPYYFQPGYGPYAGRGYQTYGFPMYPGGYLPGMPGFSYPGLGW